MNRPGEQPVAMIMAGGAGTRFWPLSTRDKPKQFIQLFDDGSLLQQSYRRIASIVPDERIMVLTNADFTGLVAEQLPNLPAANIIGEPERKDTAAAICLGALLARHKFGNPVLMVLTADQLIEPVETFQQSILSAARLAWSSGALYTIGIRPSTPNTGYGYLEMGEKAIDDHGVEHFHLASFREKPNLETARRYLRETRYLWNSGMFVWTVEAILQELETHLPDHIRHLEKAVAELDTANWGNALQRAFAALTPISIDFAVMEKAKEVRCVAGTFDWKDIGSWLALQEFLEPDPDNNRIRGQVQAIQSRNNLVFSRHPEETIAIVGVENLVVVRAGDKTLVASKDTLEQIKLAVAAMEE